MNLQFKIEEYEDDDGYDCITQTLEGDDREIWWTHHWQGWEAYAPGAMEPFWVCSRYPGEEAFAAAWQAMIDGEGVSDE